MLVVAPGPLPPRSETQEGQVPRMSARGEHAGAPNLRACEAPTYEVKMLDLITVLAVVHLRLLEA
jgi:hypothetical protein